MHQTYVEMWDYKNDLKDPKLKVFVAFSFKLKHAHLGDFGKYHYLLLTKLGKASVGFPFGTFFKTPFS